MYRNKRANKTNRKPWLSALLVVLLVLSVSTTGVFAYLKLSTQKADNSFTSAQSVNPQIKEEAFDGKVKKNVTVNVGETGYSVYVRAAVVVTWQDEAGNVYITPPVAGTDYSISYGTDNWTQEERDGYWYYKSAVESGGETAPLITECRPLKAAPIEGYTLNVKVIAQTIQCAGFTDADGSSAIQNAWKHTVP